MLTDPWFTFTATYDPGERIDTTVDALPDLDAVVITHEHYDHCDLEALAAYRDLSVPLIAPGTVVEEARAVGFTDVRLLEAWDATTEGDVTITAAPGKHGVHEVTFVIQGGDRTVYFGDAQRWLDEVTTSVVTGNYVDPSAGRISFKQFYADWSKRQLWVPKTRENADLATGSVPFADSPMKAIRRSHVEAWVKAMSTTLAASTIKTRYVIVRSAFRAAVADKVIASDPSAGIALPRQRKTDAAMRIPTVEEVGQLLAHADSQRVSTRKGFSAYVALCAFAGLRLGEAAGVQVGDVDFLRRQLTVTRQLQRDGRTYEVRPPKYGSERVVYLPDELVLMLSEHVAARVNQGEPARWLFTVGDDPMYDNAITWRWRATRKAAGLPHVRLLDLRHFYASGLIAAGCDVVTVQRALGHSTASTTLNTYSHLWPNAEDRTRAAAGGLMRDALTIRYSMLPAEES
jgi:integrase